MQQCVHQQQIQQLNRYEAINQIINYSQKNNKLLQKYSQEFFINYFDHQMIQDLVKQIPLQLQMKKQQFVRLLVNFIKHQPDQTLFLVISLINVFKRIKQQIKNDNCIKISDFTSHICEQISNKNKDKLIPLKQIVGQKIKPNPFKIRNIDLQPPIILSQIQKPIPQVLKDKNKKDKKVDPQKQLKQFLISPSLGYIMTLGSLSSMINIFNFKFQKKKQLMPSCFKKIDKKLAILSFAYSQKQQRIGAILNNIGIAFWDFCDNFRTQKLIQKTLGKKIFYLQLADQWITADNDTIYYWDLKDQNIKAKIKQKSKSVNDICQITHIRSTAVSYTFLDESKWVIIYQAQQSNLYRRSSDTEMKFQFKRLARINLSPSGCHSLYYNRFTQLIIPLGYKNDIPLYSIDNKSLDVSLLSQLKGHHTIVTCISEIDQTDIIFTGDDHGYVIVWTVSDMRCQQVIKIANQIASLKCIGNMLFYGDARINRVFIQGLTIKVESKNSQLILKNQTYYGIYKYYRSQKNQIYIFMQKTCRIINMLNGKTLKIIQICTDDQQILVAIANNTGFIIGTSKGDILHYSYDFYLKWRLNNAHTADTTQLKYDKINKFILSTGRDNNIFIWSQKTLQDEGPRKSLISNEQNNKQQICFTELSQKYGMFVTCSYTNQIRIWDYQSCKLAHVIQIQQNIHPVSIKISQKLPLMIIACSNQVILFYRFVRKQFIFSFQIIANISRKNIIKGLASSGNLYHIKKQPSIQRCSVMSKLQIKLLEDNQNNQQKQQKQQNSLQGNVQQIILNHQNNMFQVIIAYGKGKLTIIDIKSLFIKYFYITDDDTFKKSANIQRPIKQNFIKQIQKSQVKRTKFQQKKLITTLLSSQSIKWDKKVHKDTITNLDIFEGKYISTLCNDGYYKLIDMRNGLQICSLNINYPLPIKWDYKPNKCQQLCQKIHQALIVIDDILTNNQDLTKKQFQALDVKQFLDIICKKNININKLKPLKSKYNKKFSTEHRKSSPINDTNNNLLIRRTIQQNTNIYDQDKNIYNSNNKIQVLSDQFTALDIKRISKPCATLKSYEVYKRIKNFININRQNEHQHQHLIRSQVNRKKTLIQDRQSILQLLSQNYLPKLLNKQFSNYSINQFNNSNNKSTMLTLTKQDFGHNISQATNKHFNSTKYSTSPFKKIQLDKIDKFNVTINNNNNNKFDITHNNKFDTTHNNSNKFNISHNKTNQNLNKLGSNKKFNLQSIAKLSENNSQKQNNMKINRNNVIKQICQKVNTYKKVLNVIKF